MSIATPAPPVADEIPQPPTDLIEADGVPLESDWHRLAMTLLIELVGIHLKGREDYYVGGNSFIYFDAKRARARNFRGPDFFFVWDVPLNPPRRYWAIWDEGGKYPDLIIELTSPSTAEEDRGIKKHIYERTFRTTEYFLYDPEEQRLEGWHLNGRNRYSEMQANDKGWLWSEQLGLWLGTWQGKYQQKEEVYLRFFNKEGNLIPSLWERLDTESERAEAERGRADAAEAKLAQLEAQLKKTAE